MRSVSITPRQAAERLPAGETWQEHGLVFCREDGTPLDRWHVRKEFQKITQAARLGGAWTPRELRHSFVSILSANDVRLEDISDLVGHSSTVRHPRRSTGTRSGRRPPRARRPRTAA
jgi:site-specific recombinase XerD